MKILLDSVANLYDATERWKQEVIQETLESFDLAIETARRELPPAKSDQIEVINDRVRRLEERAGLARE